MFDVMAMIESQHRMRQQFAYPDAPEQHQPEQESRSRRAVAVALIALARYSEAMAHAVAPQQARVVTFRSGASPTGDIC
jgi:hypothetical protein